MHPGSTLWVQDIPKEHFPIRGCISLKYSAKSQDAISCKTKRRTPGVSIIEAQAFFLPPNKDSFRVIRKSVPLVVVWVPLPYFSDRLPVFNTQLESKTLIKLDFPTQDWPTKALSFPSKIEAN